MPRLSSFNDGYSSEVRATVSGPDPKYKNSIMLFCQDAAPTGWVRDTTDDDRMLRITNGSTISTGGNYPFRTVLSTSNQKEFIGGPVNLSTTVGGWNLTTDQIPKHTHNYNVQQEQLSPPMVSSPTVSTRRQLGGPYPSPPYPYYVYDVWAFNPVYRPKILEEPISGPYPTTDPLHTLNAAGGKSGNQYYPGRFKDAGNNGSHTHTSSNSPITWKGYWDMRIKYIDAMFAKYTG